MDDFSIKPGVPNMYGAIGGEANKIEPGKRMLSSMTPTGVSRRCTRTHSGGMRRTSAGWNASAPPGCASTCGHGSTSGTWCGLTRASSRRARSRRSCSATRSSPIWIVVARRTETSHGLSSAPRTGPRAGLRAPPQIAHTERGPRISPDICAGHGRCVASGQEADFPHVRRLEARPVPAKDRRSGGADRPGDLTDRPNTPVSRSARGSSSCWRTLASAATTTTS